MTSSKSRLHQPLAILTAWDGIRFICCCSAFAKPLVNVKALRGSSWGNSELQPCCAAITQQSSAWAAAWVALTSSKLLQPRAFGFFWCILRQVCFCCWCVVLHCVPPATAVTTFYYQVSGTDSVPPSLINDPSILQGAAQGLHKALGSPAALLVSNINAVVINARRRRQLLAPAPITLAFQIAGLTPDQATSLTEAITEPRFTGTFTQQLVTLGFTSAWSFARSDRLGSPLEPPVALAGKVFSPVGAAAGGSFLYGCAHCLSLHCTAAASVTACRCTVLLPPGSQVPVVSCSSTFRFNSMLKLLIVGLYVLLLFCLQS